MDVAIHLLQRVPQAVQLGLIGIGALFLGSKLLSFVRLVLNSFVLSGVNLRKYGKPGTWAVVTGASDGLGKEFALQLARKGFNLVLISRTASKLDALAADIENKNTGKGLQIKTLAMDFSKNNDTDYDRIAEMVKGLDVGILVNNVGQSHSIPVPFLETEKEEMQNIIMINCLGTLRVTQVVAKVLKERKRPGLILTMGSFGGWIPTAYLATYSGSKAFLQHWTNALASELADDRIDVELILSFLVTTAMSKVRRASMMIPSAPAFVKAALSKVGTGSYQVSPNTYSPWWSHALLLWVVETFTGASGPIAIWYNKKMHIDIRRRALRKAAREAKKQ